jgi:hypothetical protein
MICKTCITAGMINKRGLAFVKSGKNAAAASLFRTAESMHDECRGCDCQHTVRTKMTQ